MVLGYGQAGKSYLAVKALRQAQAEGVVSPGLIGSLMGALGNVNNVNSSISDSENILFNGEGINGEHTEHGEHGEHGKGKVDVEGLIKEMCASGLVTTRAFNDAIQFSKVCILSNGFFSF